MTIYKPTRTHNRVVINCYTCNETHKVAFLLADNHTQKEMDTKLAFDLHNRGWVWMPSNDHRTTEGRWTCPVCMAKRRKGTSC